MAEAHFTENPSPSTPLPSVPLHLSGFLNGDTIQVQGETKDRQFSVQFNIQNKRHSQSLLTFQNQPSPVSSSSSYVTPLPVDSEERNVARELQYHAVDWNPRREECHETKRPTMVTRLRSGVLYPVTYFPSRTGTVHGNSQSQRKRSSRKKRGKRNVIERILRRHSFPIRPCSSYTFFVMSTWGVAKSSTFGETSRRLGRIWCQLPPEEKKVYRDMALEDQVRYRRQCRLLRCT